MLDAFRVGIEDLRAQEDLEVAEHVANHEPEQNHAADGQRGFFADGGVEQREGFLILHF